MRTRIKRLAVLAASTTMIGAAALATAPAASAAGELQVTIHTNYADNVEVTGINQNGAYADTGWIATPHAWTRIPHWWWRTAVQIHGVGRHNGRTLESTVTCRIIPGGTPGYADCYAL